MCFCKYNWSSYFFSDLIFHHRLLNISSGFNTDLFKTGNRDQFHGHLLFKDSYLAFKVSVFSFTPFVHKRRGSVVYCAG